MPVSPMKISVFMDAYLPMHETKDPGQIPWGLLDIGIKSNLITLSKSELADYKPIFEVIQTSLDSLSADEFWAKNDYDAVVAYTWLGAQ